MYEQKHQGAFNFNTGAAGVVQRQRHPWPGPDPRDHRQLVSLFASAISWDGGGNLAVFCLSATIWRGQIRVYGRAARV